MVHLPIDSKLIIDSTDAYMVGGSVRDGLLNRPVTDFDIAVAGNARRYADKLALNLHGRVVNIGKPPHSVIRIVTATGNIDILPLNGCSIEEDLGKRDFTVNAMACHVASGKIIDIFSGIRDIEDKTIRMVSRQAFRNDPIRLLRAHRMAASLGFKISSETVSAIQKDAGKIKYSAGERIREELIKILQTETSSVQMDYMAENGLLFALIPEFRALKGCHQNEHHRFDVFEHTLKAYGFLESYLHSIDRYFPEWSEDLAQALSGNKLPLLKWAMLLHDIGKPLVRSIGPKGHIHFYQHSGKSAEIANTVDNRIRLSKKENRFVISIIQHHTRPLSLFVSEENRTLTPKGLTRMFVKCGDNTPCLLLHSLADMQGKGHDERHLYFDRFIHDVLKAFYSEYTPKTQGMPMVTGHDLIQEFGLSPSPLFKIILDKVEEARLSGILKNKTEAMQYAKSIETNLKK